MSIDFELGRGEGPGEIGVNHTDFCPQKFMAEGQVPAPREIQEAAGSLRVRLCGLEKGAPALVSKGLPKMSCALCITCIAQGVPRTQRGVPSAPSGALPVSLRTWLAGCSAQQSPSDAAPGISLQSMLQGSLLLK